MKALGWLCVALVISLVLPGCGNSNSSTVTISISPSSATVLLGTSVQFIPNVAGSSNAVTWSVNGVVNGDATFGTISPSGLYTAPATRPVEASGAAVPVVLALAHASIPNSGSAGAVVELKGGSNFTNFSPGNTITISENSVAGWDGSFIILAVAQLPNGNVGVQIPTPPGPPANGVGGTAKATPNIAITAQVSSTNAVASATITLDSGIRVSFAQPTCTIGTGETFPFKPFVTVSGTSDQTVKWTLTGVGTIDATGLYTAPNTTGTATITATSAADPTESASVTVTVAAAVDPGLSAISPPTGALGAASLDVYLSGSNFICTTKIFVNNSVTNTTTQIPPGSFFSLSSSTFLVVLPDSFLSTPPTSGTTVTLTFTVERKASTTPQGCASTSNCQLTLSPVRPALVASKPDSIPLPSGAFGVTLDGGYFGSANLTAGVQGSPVVNVLVNGQLVPVLNSSNGSTSHFRLTDRQLTLSLSPTPYLGSTAMPGLFPVTVVNTVSCPTIGVPSCETASVNGPMAAANLAVQPTSAPAQLGSPIPVGTNPSSVAVDTATGFAVVANQGSNDITIVNLGTLTSPSLTISMQSLCTGSLGSVSGPSCPVASGPVSVAVDNLRHLALVANSGNATLAVVNTSTPTAPTVTALLSFPSADSSGNPLSLAPQAVGINPVTGRALVAFSTSSGAGGSNAGAILDLTKSPPALINVVNLSNGPKPHLAVSPRLNWALATPGGAGSLSIVDLGRQTTNTITSLSCSANFITVSTAATPGLLAGQPVLITGATPANNGIFQVASVSNSSFTYAQSCGSVPTLPATVSYALPVASVATDPNLRGVSINDETQKALFAEPTSGVPAFTFNILDQTSVLVQAIPTANNVATAMDPLTNIGLVANLSGQISVVDPVTPAVIPSASFSTVNPPVDVAFDPAANTALILTSGSPGALNLFSLPALRPGPQIIQSSFIAVGSASTAQASRVTVNSSLGSAATASDQTVTLVGSFTSGSVPRLDGDSSPFTGVTVSNGGRLLTATLSGSFLVPPPPTPSRGPRLYVLDVIDTSSQVSNVAPLQVIQAVSLATGSCSNPAPQGVAIDASHNVAVVTEPGCNEVSLVNLATGNGFGAKHELAVGTNPQGVAVYPQAGLAVAANAGSSNSSIVDIVNGAVPQTITTEPIPSGVAIDLGTGKAVVTANGASVVDVFPVSNSTTAPTPTTIGVQSGPSGVAIDQKNHVAVVANSSSNTASVVSLPSNTATLTSNLIIFPQGVAFDPLSDTFLITSGATNQVVTLNPNTVSASAIRVGIDPSSIAYNFESGTLVTANNLSGTITVVDFIDQTVRGVFSLRSSTQFAVDIHPQTNLAVVADTVDNQLLLVPLPH